MILSIAGAILAQYRHVTDTHTQALAYTMLAWQCIVKILEMAVIKARGSDIADEPRNKLSVEIFLTGALLDKKLIF